MLFYEFYTTGSYRTAIWVQKGWGGLEGPWVLFYRIGKMCPTPAVEKGGKYMKIRFSRHTSWGKRGPFCCFPRHAISAIANHVCFAVFCVVREAFIFRILRFPFVSWRRTAFAFHKKVRENDLIEHVPYVLPHLIAMITYHIYMYMYIYMYIYI